LVPSLRVSTSSDTGTGLSLAAYFGFAIFEEATNRTYHDSHNLIDPEVIRVRGVVITNT